MADGLTHNIAGLDALVRKFRTVTDDMERRGGRFALRKAAQVIRDQAKQNALRVDDPATGRKIADNVTERWSGRHFKRTGDLMFRIGVMGGGRKRPGNPDEGPGGPTPHFHLVELGTEHSAAQPFLRPAAENNAGSVIGEFVSQYEKALDRALKRAGGR